MIKKDGSTNNRLRRWELALAAGLLIGLLGGSADAAPLPLSRWPAGQGEARYQVSVFPFGFAQAEEQVLLRETEEREEDYVLGVKVLEWWQAWFGEASARSKSSDRE